MSKYSDHLISTYRDTKTVAKLTKDIKDAIDKKKRQREIDQAISDVIKGKYKRKYGRN